MQNLLPFPILSALLLATWLLLNQSVSLGQVLLGAALALFGGWMLLALQPPKGRVRRPGAVARLAAVVIADVVRSNLAVSRIILGPRHRSLTSGFMNIRLELRNRYGLAILACIITATPGTLWVNFNPASGILLIHVLDLIDERTWVATIKGRYERLLLEIFE